MAAGRPARRRHLEFEEVGSTNSVALEAARAGDPGRLWITAARQSAGRGRRGRAWTSERGNLYASLLLLDPAPLEHLGNLPLVVALGVRNGLAALRGLDPDDVRIKWPNDILIRGGKSVGILIESERVEPGHQAVVVGCGVNVEYLPTEAPYAVTGLRREGATGSLTEIFEALAGGVEAALDKWARGRHFSEIRQAWIENCVGMGDACRVNLPSGETVEGQFLDLDSSGRLILGEPGGARRTFSAGDLFLLPGSGALPARQARS